MKRVIFSLWLLVLISTSVLAQIPRIINYQGWLLGADEAPVPEGDYKITFRLYDESETPLWTEVHNQIFVAGGLFHVILGTVEPLDLPFDQPYFLGIQVGNDPELQPRMMMTSAAYSLRAEDANTVGGISASTTPEPNTLLSLDSNGTFPSSVLPADVSGDYLRKNVPDTTTSSSYGEILRVVNAGAGHGIVGSCNSLGVIGASHSAGVYGEAANTNQDEINYGGYFISKGGQGSGVFGGATGGAGRGVYGEATGNNGQGVRGYAPGTNGVGVYGVGSTGVRGESSSGDGVIGESTAENKSGVYGHNTNGVGVKGRSDNNDGIVGSTDASDKSGVFGHSEFGIGVTGRSGLNDGLLAVTTSRIGAHAGLRARNEGGGSAIICEGDLYVTDSYKGNIGPNGGASFPRPAFDSGLQSYNNGEVKTFNHNIGENVDNYVVDIQLSGSLPGDDKGRHNMGACGDKFSSIGFRGAYWSNLTPTSITVTREGSDLYADKIRVRIWVYR